MNRIRRFVRQIVYRDNAICARIRNSKKNFLPPHRSQKQFPTTQRKKQLAHPKEPSNIIQESQIMTESNAIEVFKAEAKLSRPALENPGGPYVEAEGTAKLFRGSGTNVVRFVNYLGHDGLNARIVKNHRLARYPNHKTVVFEANSETYGRVHMQTKFTLTFTRVEDADKFARIWYQMADSM